jgi:hypothetical protein
MAQIIPYFHYMENDEFEITFKYKNINLSAIVHPGEEEDKTYIVQIYTPGWEQMLEIWASDSNEVGEIEWQQINEESGQIGSDPEMIQLIGKAIELFRF